MIIRAGVDVVDINRLTRLVENGGSVFLDQGWTAAEQQVCAAQPERFATRWGAKEAVMKVLGAGFPEVEHCEIEIVTEADGRPSLNLTGEAHKLAERLHIKEWSVSLSHDAGVAVAFVIGMRA